MIVITNPSSVINEIKIIHSLFEAGLELLHIRKPDYSEEKMKAFLSEIKVVFRTRLILHNHHQLAEDFGLNRFHFSEKDRKKTKPNRFLKPVRFPLTISTSTHSIDEFNALSNVFDYAFLSPVFPSISKENYQSKEDLLEALKKRTNFNTKLIALGGIQSKNINQVHNAGFDDIALLGSIWNSSNPLANFKLCQKNALSY